MKPILTVLILLTVIIAGGLMTHNLLQAESRLLSEKLDMLCVSVDNEDWDKADELYKGILEAWKKSNKKYSMLIDHFEIDNININFAELKAFISVKDKSPAKAKILSLKVLILHMAEKEAINLKNIF